MRRGINLALTLCYGCFHVHCLAEEQRLFHSREVLGDTLGGSVAHFEIVRSKTSGWSNSSAVLPIVFLLHLLQPCQRSSADERRKGPMEKCSAWDSLWFSHHGFNCISWTWREETVQLLPHAAGLASRGDSALEQVLPPFPFSTIFPHPTRAWLRIIALSDAPRLSAPLCTTTLIRLLPWLMATSPPWEGEANLYLIVTHPFSPALSSTSLSVHLTVPLTQMCK